MSQPDEGACVHVIDARWPRISTRDRLEIALVAPYSRIENVVTDVQPADPPGVVFGPEPPHGWCYLYQKAELALQTADWEEVLRLGEQAAQQGLAPNDPVEWIPFLQAYGYLGEEASFRGTAAKITDDPFLRAQACAAFQSMRRLGFEPPDRIETLVSDLFCG
jgi:hypothetical protein